MPTSLSESDATRQYGIDQDRPSKEREVECGTMLLISRNRRSGRFYRRIVLERRLDRLDLGKGVGQVIWRCLGIFGSGTMSAESLNGRRAVELAAESDDVGEEESEETGSRESRERHQGSILI